PKQKSITATALKAAVVMPSLEGVTLVGGSKVTCTAFKSARAFKARLTHASTLEGEIDANRLDIEAADGTTGRRRGMAKEARASASRSCVLSLVDCAIDHADITLTEGSTAKVNVKDNLDYTLTSACRLEYRGSPAIGRHEATGGSSVARLTQ